MPERLCLICQKPLADLNPGDVCFCHDVQLTKKELAELKRKAAESQKPELEEQRKREICVVSGGLCWICYKAAKGKTGEERERALADAKARIKSGQLKTWKKLTPAPPEESTGTCTQDHQKKSEPAPFDNTVRGYSPIASADKTLNDHEKLINKHKRLLLHQNKLPTSSSSPTEVCLKIFLGDRELLSLPLRIEVV